MPMKDKVSQDELKAELHGKVEGIVNGWREDPAQIAEYLQFTTRFPQYSHANTRLLYAQNPNASYVASASAFRAGLPNKNGVPLSETPVWIKKGERAMRIWCPTVRTFVKKPETGVWEPVSHLSAVDRERAKAENREIREACSFTLVPVFDVSQTDLSQELYPKLMGFGQETPDTEVFFRAARFYAEGELHCPVRENVDLHNALVRGAFSPTSNEIMLSELLRGDGKLSTLLHEIGHAELHADPAAANLSTAQRELEADMYALMLEQTMGVPTTDARKAHLSGHYKAYLQELQRAAEEKPLSLGADSAPFENVIRRYRQQLPKVEEYIDLAKEAMLQEAEAEQVQQSAQIDDKQNVQREPTAVSLSDYGRVSNLSF